MKNILRFLTGLVLALATVLLGSCNSESLTGPTRSDSSDHFLLKTALRSTGIELFWENSEFPEVLVFRVDRSETPADLLPVAEVANTYWTDTDTGCDQIYYYRITGLGEDGSEIAQSRVISATRPAAVQFLVNGGATYVPDPEVVITLEAAGCVSALIWNGAEADSSGGQEFPLTGGSLTLGDWTIPGGEGDKIVWAKLRYDTEDINDPDKTELTSVQYQYPLVLDQSPPHVPPSLVAPLAGSITRDYRVELHWSSGADQLSPELDYQVYLWTDDRSEQDLYRGPSRSCTTTGLQFETTYFWRVVVIDQAGNEAGGPTWSFTATDDLVLIEPGTFTMGSPYDEPGRNVNETQHSVTLTRGFRVSPFEVTEEMWDDVLADGNSTSQRPRANVSWDQAIQFCNALSLKRGLDPVYDATGSGQVSWNPQANGYRLLTEAEWEYACRATATTAFANGEITDTLCQDPVLDQIGRYCGNGDNESGNVGGLPPNAWGLHDMHGNLWEWCWDYYQGTYLPGPVTDPVAGGYTQDSAANYRIIRGGNFCNHADDCRSASRSSSPADHSGYGIGFRLARYID